MGGLLEIQNYQDTAPHEPPSKDCTRSHNMTPDVALLSRILAVALTVEAGKLKHGRPQTPNPIEKERQG